MHANKEHVINEIGCRWPHSCRLRSQYAVDAQIVAWQTDKNTAHVSFQSQIRPVSRYSEHALAKAEPRTQRSVPNGIAMVDSEQLGHYLGGRIRVWHLVFRLPPQSKEIHQ